MKLKLVAAFAAIEESLSKAFKVSIASGSWRCLRNITALFISNSPTNFMYSELLIASTHQSKPTFVNYNKNCAN